MRIAMTWVVVMAAGSAAQASLTLLPSGPMMGSHVGNLVTNGSFETRNAIGQPGPGGTLTSVLWATGTLGTPFAVPFGWTSSGGPNTYATWGRSSAGPSRIRGSAALPDGVNALYFGNGQGATTSLVPNFNPDGEVTFAGTPSVSPVGGAFPVPCVLTQTVNTHLAPAASYILSFWVSGEESGDVTIPGLYNDGIFGLRVTNTQAGDPMRYFAVPGFSGRYGTSIRFEFSFVPLNPLAPVTLEFYNWGHFSTAGWTGSATGTTELVLDDVIVNPVEIPGPGAAALLALAGGLTARRRR